VTDIRALPENIDGLAGPWEFFDAFSSPSEGTPDGEERPERRTLMKRIELIVPPAGGG